MTITQVKEINEKIIELADYIRRYRLEALVSNSVDFIIHIGNADYQLGRANDSFIEGWYFISKHRNMKYAEGALNEAATAVFKAYQCRCKAKDDIPLDEISLWIDLFTLVY